MFLTSEFSCNTLCGIQWWLVGVGSGKCSGRIERCAFLNIMNRNALLFTYKDSVH